MKGHVSETSYLFSSVVRNRLWAVLFKNPRNLLLGLGIWADDREAVIPDRTSAMERVFHVWYGISKPA